MPDIALNSGATLVYDDRGPRSARPILLIHGVSMSRRYFHKQLKPLAVNHRVIAVDLRGHGDSPDMEAGNTVPQYARDVKMMIDALELDRPVVLGWSMGAFVVWDFIRQFGTSPITGVIVSDEAATDFKWENFDHGFVDLPTLHALMTSVQEDRAAFLAGLIPQMFHNEQSAEDLAWMTEESSKLSIGATASILFDQCVQDYRDVLKTIDVPTLICWGRHDQLLPVSGASHLHQHIAGSQLEIFERSGHCPFIEESTAFNEVIDAFMRSTDPR